MVENEEEVIIVSELITCAELAEIIRAYQKDHPPPSSSALEGKEEVQP